MMFLLQRKSDGKFWKNPANEPPYRLVGGRFQRDTESCWTHDPNKCRPFKTRGGAKHSRGMHTVVPWSPNRSYEMWHRLCLEAVNVVPVRVEVKL